MQQTKSSGEMGKQRNKMMHKNDVVSRYRIATWIASVHVVSSNIEASSPKLDVVVRIRRYVEYP